jgi:signal transduction histidine kinase
VLVPAVILAVGYLELLAVRPTGWQTAAVLESVSLALLVLRRQVPLAAGVASAVVLLSIPWAGPALDDLATPILVLALICYSLARWIADLRGLLGLAAVLLVLLADYLFGDARSHDFTDVVFVSALTIPPYVFGRVTRKLAVQSERLEQQQAVIREQAVRAERDRIARELHDVIAHSLSAMVVQTAAAQDLIRVAPDRAQTLLQSVADTGRSALVETGRLLHLIRDDADELGLTPPPGLADVPALVGSLRQSGLEVEAELRLPSEPLAAGVDVSAYRVVQEALTNALKYGDGRARLRVVAEPNRLHITCSNPLGGSRQSGSGLGLQGMAERISLLGGTLTSGSADGAFVVDGDIPIVRDAVS